MLFALGLNVTVQRLHVDTGLNPVQLGPLGIHSFDIFTKTYKLAIMALMPTLCSHIFAVFFIIWIIRC